ncbi:MAG: hypothetical protein M3N38_00910, partial [Pseudomonadota bacterium]|nr:hypothetical protein [Pseudomonadota bacterium]
RELMAMVKRRRNGHVVKDDFAGPVLIAVAVSAAIAVLSVTSFIPQPDQPTTYLSQLSTWSPISGG